MLSEDQLRSMPGMVTAEFDREPWPSLLASRSWRLAFHAPFFEVTDEEQAELVGTVARHVLRGRHFRIGWEKKGAFRIRVDDDRRWLFHLWHAGGCDDLYIHEAEYPRRMFVIGKDWHHEVTDDDLEVFEIVEEREE
jgi:hypothetical protein